MRKVVYTVLSGGYDEIQPINIKHDEIDFIVVSDEIITVPNGWKLIVIDNDDEKGLLFNRKYKINPQILFSNYDASIYIDSNIEIVGSVSELFESLVNEQYLMMAYDHPVRDKLYEEANELKLQGFDSFIHINRQVSRYYSEGYVDDGFYEANVLVRKHQGNLFQVMETWYNLFTEGVKRDQLSLTYSFWYHDTVIGSLGVHDARFINRIFKYHMHVKKNPTNRTLNKIVNLISIKLKIDKELMYD
ncbi:DUF616 domain-containing protein [Vibrio furnissii]|uniref:glycosyltransferase domain-containing protein n=1 Tax=Vibrio furnissii TaxID=29494 RepID=UPI0024BAA025|nr:glycosyltransferase domain-containing protein [Vibrio furnissii]WHR51327.1 DUF616 domain-containing protein [Vibrio furnissii]